MASGATLDELRHASLFSGIGGFDLAAEWMGWNNVMQCEIDPFCQRVLRHHFPFTKLYGDIREIDGNEWRGKIDILTGGFPCQPFSAAGRRRGTEDNRFLWPEMLRVIREIQPTWIVAENVRGIVSQGDGVVFERVHAEMEANGYEVQSFCIPACAVGAPHKRERIWFIAHNKSEQNRRVQQPQIFRDTRNEIESDATNGSSLKCERRECERSSERQPETPIGNGNSNASDAESVRRDYGETKNKRKTASHVHAPSDENGLSSGWEQTWLQVATRLCRVDDGLPRKLDGITVPRWRRESLKAYGNAIVPQVAFEIFKAISINPIPLYDPSYTMGRRPRHPEAYR